jgi:hypothetical protein
VRKEKVCIGCSKIHSYSTVLCQNCHITKRKYGSLNPKEWEISCELCKNTFVNKWRNAKYCPECRTRHRLVTGEKRYKKNPNAKPRKRNGEGTITKAGYRHITKVGHPNASINGKIQEHTFVMSAHLGRPLAKHESVHHKNGIRSDNRLENLELWSRYQPIGQRVEDKVKWAKEILDMYKEFI